MGGVDEGSDNETRLLARYSPRGDLLHQMSDSHLHPELHSQREPLLLDWGGE